MTPEEERLAARTIVKAAQRWYEGERLAELRPVWDAVTRRSADDLANVWTGRFEHQRKALEAWVEKRWT